MRDYIHIEMNFAFVVIKLQKKRVLKELFGIIGTVPETV